MLPVTRLDTESAKGSNGEENMNGPRQGTVSERYTRIQQLGWNLDVLQKSTVLVVGAGALGNEIIKNLALVGLGNLLVIDFDKIETHNLTRSVLFRVSDIGRGKAEVAAQAAKDIEPGINVRWFDTALQYTLGLGVFRRVDVVLGAVDNLQTRREINRACIQANTPFIDGGLYFLDGDVRVFLPPFDVCFDCTLTEEERVEGWRRWSCLQLSAGEDHATGPTAPTVASMVGGLQAQLALKFLHRDQDTPYPMSVPNGVRVRFNGFADEYERWNLSRDTLCPTHSSAIPMLESSIRTVPLGRDVEAAGILKVAQESLGPEAFLELGFDLVYELSCQECGRCEPISRRLGTVAIGEALCPRCTPTHCSSCGNLLADTFTQSPETVFPDHADCAVCFQSNRLVLRDALIVNRIEAGSPILNRSLLELTVPMWDILEAKSFDKSSIFLQLDGDKNEALGITP